MTFRLGTAARVTASVRGFEGGSVVVVLNENRPAGANAFDLAAAGLPDGRYTLLVTAARAGSPPAAQQIALVVDRTLYGLTLRAPTLSPNGDGVLDTLPVSFTLTRAAPVRIDVRRAGVVFASPFAGPLPAAPYVLEWNGATTTGARAPDGAYEVAVTVTDVLGDVTYTVPFTLDTTPPTLALLDLAALRFQVDEPATVSLLVNGQPREVTVQKGTFTVPWTGPAPVTSVSAQARDAAGNVGAAVRSP